MLIVVLYSPHLVVAMNKCIILRRSADDEASEGAKGGKRSVADEATGSPKQYDELGRCGSAANFLFSILIEGHLNPPSDKVSPIGPPPNDALPIDCKVRPPSDNGPHLNADGNFPLLPKSPDGNALSRLRTMVQPTIPSIKFGRHPTKGRQPMPTVTLALHRRVSKVMLGRRMMMG